MSRTCDEFDKHGYFAQQYWFNSGASKLNRLETCGAILERVLLL